MIIQNAYVMKTTKLILSIALVALTVTSFGRIGEPSIVNENDMVVESWMLSPFEAMENDLVLECWMSKAFDIAERDLAIENWMTTPFDELDEPLTLEDWMIKPFATDVLALETWMSIPFQVETGKYNAVMMAASE